jgi:hypothetical protein
MSSVERPVIYDVIRQLMELTGLSDKTMIRFFGEDAQAAQWGSTIGAAQPYRNLWPHRAAVTIEVEEDFDPNHMLNMAVKDSENPYLFVDRDLNVLVKPAYSPSNVTIKVVYHGVDKNEAQKWRNDVRTRYVQGRELNLHTLTYSYALPAGLEGLLLHVYDLRSNVAPDGLSLGQWWAKCASPKFTKVVTQAGTHPVIVVAETQSNVQGYFDFEGAPERQSKSSEPDMWEVSFSYKFKYDKPIEMNAQYPLVVHQQPLAEQFRQFNNAKPHEDILRQLSLSGQYLNNFTGNAQLAKRLANKGVTLPLEDDWLPLQGTVPSSTVKVLTGMAGISAEDKRSLLDLTDLGNFMLTPEIVAFMKESEYPYMSGHAASIFQITVYEGYNVLPISDIEVTSGLMVRATRDLDLRKLYHVRLGLHGKIIGLQSAAVARLRRYPAIVLLLAKALAGALTESGSYSDLRKSGLNAHDLALLGIQGPIPSTYGYSLFQTMFVVANRMGQYHPAPPIPVTIERPFVPI